MSVGTGVDVALVSDVNSWGVARRNEATNPQPANTTYAEWYTRWSFGWTWSGTGGPFGVYPYFRWTSPSSQTITSRGWDIFGNMDLATPLNTGTWNWFWVNALEPITLHYYVRSSVATTWSTHFRIHNGAGAWLTAVTPMPGIAVPANTWTPVRVVYYPTASGYLVASSRSIGAQTIPAGGTIDGSRLMLEYGGYYDDFYTDGDAGTTMYASSTWDGAPGDSKTTYRAPEPGEVMFKAASYSAVEDATPLDPSDNTGGFGQITVTMPESDTTKLAMGRTLSLTDGAMGKTIGRVRSLAGDNGEATLVANSRLGQIAVERTVAPMYASLSDCLEYLMLLCGINSGVVTDAWMDSYWIVMPGSRSNVHDLIHRLCAAHDFEMSLVSDNVVFRSPRGRTAVNYRDASISWTMSQDGLARSVEGWAYNSRAGNDLVYPLNRDVSAAQVYQVAEGETQVFEIPVNASLALVDQPTPVSIVDYNDFASSQYTVYGSDDSIVQPVAWTTAGGEVRVAIAEDSRTLIVTIVGARIPSKSPFRIAMPRGENQVYSSLRIRGDGIFWDKELVTLELGGSVDTAPDEVGVRVDNEFMENRDQLFHRLLRTAERYGTDRMTISVSTSGINRLGESGSAVYPTIGDLAAMYPGATIATIATQLGPTIADWNAELFALVATDFENQAFGNVAGARVLHDRSWYRIRTATLRPHGIDYSAERDNIVSDVYYTGENIAQWNARWAGATIRDVNIAPLMA